jgi:type II secretory pathway pseudopilin PulG
VSERAHTFWGPAHVQRGVTLVELMVTATISLLIIAGLSRVIQVTLDSKTTLKQQIELAREASFAMQRMLSTVSHSRRLLLPLDDNPATNWPEHIREQTVPPSAPIGDSTAATAVLAVTLPAHVDLNFDGVPDADDDGDGLIDEDLPNDIHLDYTPGIILIDDDGDGQIDEGLGHDDDEGGTVNEDRLDGIDNDGDGSVDEDVASDNSGNGCPGFCGVDDDGDGQIDEGAIDDDDEDGNAFDDPYDPVVFYLNAGVLMERMPVPWNEDGLSSSAGPVDGRDFIVSPIASDVTRVRFERVPDSPLAWDIVDITLELTGDDGQVVSLNRRVRLGGAL